MDETMLRSLFEKSQDNHEKMQFSSEETNRFQKAFEDPEFRKLFADYMDELQDPQNREETEAYISQLEGEKKVPDGKELIRPEPSFVVKTFKTLKDTTSYNDNKHNKEKVFLNIVQSLKINEPSKTETSKGVCWSLPYSVGPPHMEKDKNGFNTPCFDCCFHPEAIRLGKVHKEFKELLITTAMDGVEQAYKRQSQEVKLSSDFHIVKGITYKQGQVLTMMISIASKDNWNTTTTSNNNNSNNNKNNDATNTNASNVSNSTSNENTKHNNKNISSDCNIDEQLKLDTIDNEISNTSNIISTTSNNNNNVTNTNTLNVNSSNSSILLLNDSKKDTKKTDSSSNNSTGIKKGFLSNTKTCIYGDKLTTIRASEHSNESNSSNNIILPSATTNSSRNEDHKKEETDKKIKLSTTTTNSLIREVKPNDTNNVSSNTSNNVCSSSSNNSSKANKETSLPAGLKAVSSTKRILKDPPEISVTSPEVVTNTITNTTNNNNTTTTNATKSSGVIIETPKYTVKERGHLSMGDFELTNASTAKSNRPSELVYRIELPKVTKAALIGLEVAERNLNLTYEYLYSLSVKLPYPVFDTKGKAKYDKAGKVLEVTLPVKPPAPSTLTRTLNGTEDAVPVDSIVQELFESSRQTTTQDFTTATTMEEENLNKNKATSKTHSRWISTTPKDLHSKDMVEDTDVRVVELANKVDDNLKSKEKVTLSLHEEIKLQAQLALEGANKLQTTTSTSSNTTSSSITQNTHKITTADNNIDFIPSLSFKAEKKGYVFKNSDKGKGYYLDTIMKIRNEATNNILPEQSLEDTVASTKVTNILDNNNLGIVHHDTYQSFEFDCKQTKETIAILVQVPNIDRNTVSIQFHSHHVDIAFKTLSSNSSSIISDSDITKTLSLLYGLSLQISAVDNICKVGFNPIHCKYDVACHNMAIVLVKSIPNYWSATTTIDDNDNTTNFETKSNMQQYLQQTKSIFKICPYSVSNTTTTTDNNNKNIATKKDIIEKETSKLVQDTEELQKEIKLKKSLEAMIDQMQFNSSSVIFDLD